MEREFVDYLSKIFGQGTIRNQQMERAELSEIVGYEAMVGRYEISRANVFPILINQGQIICPRWIGNS